MENGRSSFAQGASKAEFVAIRVTDMEVTLAPGCVGWLRFRPVSGIEDASEHIVDVLNPEHDPTPDALPSSDLDCLLQVEEAASDLKTREGGVFTSIQNFKTEIAVERNRFVHIRRQESYRADGPDGTRSPVHLNSLAATQSTSGRVWTTRLSKVCI
jgi:hypothetical protein